MFSSSVFLLISLIPFDFRFLVGKLFSFSACFRISYLKLYNNLIVLFLSHCVGFLVNGPFQPRGSCHLILGNLVGWFIYLIFLGIICLDRFLPTIFFVFSLEVFWNWTSRIVSFFLSFSLLLSTCCFSFVYFTSIFKEIFLGLKISHVSYLKSYFFVLGLLL